MFGSQKIQLSILVRGVKHGEVAQRSSFSTADSRALATLTVITEFIASYLELVSYLVYFASAWNFRRSMLLSTSPDRNILTLRDRDLSESPSAFFSLLVMMTVEIVRDLGNGFC